MAKIVKKAVRKKIFELEVGNTTIEVIALSDKEVAKADARIQKKVQPVFSEIRKARRTAMLSASKIILNV